MIALIVVAAVLATFSGTLFITLKYGNEMDLRSCFRRFVQDITNGERDT